MSNLFNLSVLNAFEILFCLELSRGVLLSMIFKRDFDVKLFNLRFWILFSMFASKKSSFLTDSSSWFTVNPKSVLEQDLVKML